MILVLINFIRSFNKVLNFPAFWENEVLLNALIIYFLYFIYKSVISWRDVTTNTCGINHVSIHVVQAFIKILQKEMFRDLMLKATWIEILEPLPKLIKGLPRLLLDARNFLPYGCCPWSYEELGKEQSLQVIPTRCKVVQPVFCIAL